MGDLKNMHGWASRQTGTADPPVGGSDGVNEALPTHYQASNTHHHIITADRARSHCRLMGRL